MIKRLMIAAALAAGPLVAAAPSAQANPALAVQIISGSQSVLCDNCATGGGTFSGGASGTFTQNAQGDITFVGTVGASTLNVTIAEGANFIATPQVVLNNAQTVSTGGPVTLEASDYGQTLANPTAITSNFSTSTDVSGPASGTFETFYSMSNQEFTGISLTGGPQTITGALNQVITAPGIIPAGSGNLSDSIVVTLTQPNGNSFGFTSSITVPEPASLSLLGTALLGLGLFGLRRKRA